jgi:hypothetical protein
MTTDVGICNLALQRLGARTISALNENSTAARACNRVYEHARDTEIRAYSWSFARARASLAASTTVPAFGFLKQYQLPADFIRLIPSRVLGTTVTTEGGIDPNIDWQIEGRFILTNDSSPLKIVYLKKVTDEETFDDLFSELLVSRIAMDVCEKVTQSNTKKKDATERYVFAQKEAKKINAFERPPIDFPQSEWVLARL